MEGTSGHSDHIRMTALNSTRILETFSSYNQAVWPLQPVLWAIGVAVVALALKDVPWRGRTILVLLAVLWGWMAVAYQWKFVAQVSPLGKVFAGLFLAQAVLLLWFALRPATVHFRPQGDLLGIAGSFMVACALMIHPVLAIRAGHGYPAFPTFGVPSPTIIFTIGVMLWAKPRPHEIFIVIPTLWTLSSVPSMLSLSAVQDWLLPIAVTFAAGFILWQKQVARLNRLANLPQNPAFARAKGEVRRREAEARREAHATQRAQRWSAQPMRGVGETRNAPMS
jgi:hypothetical protein